MIEFIKNFWQYGSNRAKNGAVVLCFLTLLIIIIAIIWLFNPAAKEDLNIQITNSDEISNVPEDYQTSIKKLIWYKIEDHLDLPGIVYEDAEIREGSYKEETIGDVVTANFIIDIESLRYSFAVTAKWNKKSPSKDFDIQIQCPHYIDAIYTDTKCIAASPTDQLRRYLPHYEVMPDGQKINADFRTYAFYQEHAGESYLAVEVSACGNEETLSSAKTIIINWLKSIYLDPNDYYIEMLDTCH